TAEDGSAYRFYYEPDCCASCDIEDIAGDLGDLLGSPILFAYESSSDPEPTEGHHPRDSYTWTFYRFGTINGTVVVRWLGESNGGYSESVSFEKIPASAER
ncbi:MAG: hypothetical protein ABIT01_21080, partial [Thermoanaerobaculia bacterium]